MSIEEIKAQLSIQTVLSHYGLSSNKNGMLNCPFHEDKKASMRIYEKTNTVYCFAGSCKVESLDVIDFIMFMEKLTKREAILKAKNLCNISSIKISPKPTIQMKKENPQTSFKRYHKSLHNHKPAQEYCESRCLDWRLLEIGYKSRQTVTKWGRACIIFPLLNESGSIVDLYGRSIVGGGHYYNKDRKGLYPEYPSRRTRYLILCESIIDTATLQALDLGLENYGLLSLYGTNGLTEEHLLAISRLVDLEEIIFGLDEDKAGSEGVESHTRTLSRLHPAVRISRIKLAHGFDINSVAENHTEYKDIFKDLIANRVVIKESATPTLPDLRTQKKENHLDTSDPYNLIYTTAVAQYYIKGGVRCSAKDLGSMKVTLVVVNKSGKKSRNGLDLYEDRQIERTARHIGDRLDLRADLVELDLHALTDELEIYRKEIQTESGKNKEKVEPASAEEMESYLKFWKGKDLMSSIDKILDQYGIIGEYENRKLGFCIASSSQMLEPLHGLIQGSSGSGKTHLLTKLCDLIPEETYIGITRATDNSFYNYGKYDLKNKLISIEDKDSMSEDANLAFRELQSKGKVSLSTTGQDEKGHNQAYVKTVYGPIASLACTTKGELYLDDMNRCFLLAVDESEAQTKRILVHQKSAAAGQTGDRNKELIQNFMQGALRALETYEVVIPQATEISLPETVKDKRRLNSLYLSLVKQITLLHQYQRSKNEAGQLVATKQDLTIANEIMFEAIVLKVDDLHGSLRSFYEKLKAYLKKVGGAQAERYGFKQREIRQSLRLGKTTISDNVRVLVEMEYIKITGGSDRRGLQYEISYWDDNELLRSRIKSYLESQIEKL